MTERVESALDSAPVYKFPAVKVTTLDAVVQLSGFVESQDQKQNATQIAQSVPGVQRVENSTTIQPPSARGGGNGQNFQGQGHYEAPIIYPQGQIPNRAIRLPIIPSYSLTSSSPNKLNPLPAASTNQTDTIGPISRSRGGGPLN